MGYSYTIFWSLCYKLATPKLCYCVCSTFLAFVRYLFIIFKLHGMPGSVEHRCWLNLTLFVMLDVQYASWNIYFLYRDSLKKNLVFLKHILPALFCLVYAQIKLFAQFIHLLTHFFSFFTFCFQPKALACILLWIYKGTAWPIFFWWLFNHF